MDEKKEETPVTTIQMLIGGPAHGTVRQLADGVVIPTKVFIGAVGPGKIVAGSSSQYKLPYYLDRDIAQAGMEAREGQKVRVLIYYYAWVVPALRQSGSVWVEESPDGAKISQGKVMGRPV